jgi:predicted dinucleotide-binding enzyme
MKIVTVGRGRIGGGLALLWLKAGHEVITLGRDGGDGSVADVVLIAVPGGAITAALANVTGIAGKVTIDATNAYGQRSTAFTSQAHQIKSIVAGSTAKSFNTNWAVLYAPPGRPSPAHPSRRLGRARAILLPHGARGTALIEATPRPTRDRYSGTH